MLADPAQSAILKRVRARGRVRHKPGEMNKLEAEYANYLKLRLASGEIIWWKFEALKFRLAEKTTYTPDFLVMQSDGTLECHEVKAFWEDDARVKIKVAAEMFPLVFKAARMTRDGWAWEEF